MPAPDTATQAFQDLTPDDILQTIESLGYHCNGSLLALNSYENRVYQVGLEEDEPIIAKFYRPQRWSDAAINEEHDFTQELADEEMPVVAPLRNSQSQSLHHHEQFRFALYPRRGGRAPELDNSQHLEIIGRFLARMHLQGEQKDFQHRPSVDIVSYLEQPSKYLLQSGHVPPALETAYHHLIDDVQAKINDHFQAAGKVQSLRIHADSHPGNILWRDETLNIVDFDDARMGPAVQDIWLFLSGDRLTQTGFLADIMEGYTQFRDFNPRELQLIEPLRTLRMVHFAAWLAQRADDPAFSLAFPWFYTARFWDEHILGLKEQSAILDEDPLIWD